MSQIQIAQQSVMANCHQFAEGSINLQSFSDIPAVKHATTIAQLCQQYPLISQARLYCAAIVHNDSQFFYTSNDPYLSAAYISTGLYRVDNFFHQALQSGRDVLLANHLDNSDVMRQLVASVLSLKFNLYNCYCLVRRCEDCDVIIAIAMHENIKEAQTFYQQTYAELQQFTTVYFDHFI